MRRSVKAIYDSHYPYTIPLEPFLKYCAEDETTDFILGGDNWDLGFLSHWNDANFKNIGFNSIRRQLYKEAEGLRAQIRLFKKAMPKAQFYYIEGNHEYWIKQFTSKYSQMADLSLQTLLADTTDVKYIPYIDSESSSAKKDYIQIGKLYFRHGHQYGSANPVKQGLERSHKSIVIGHHHGHIAWSNHSDIDSSEQHAGWLVPCYRKRQVGYGHGSPHRWMNGFFWAHVAESGNFSAGVQLVSPQGHFITQSGKEYR